MVKLKKWAYAPTISANYNYTHKLLKPDLDMSPKHSAAITMSIPVFSGLKRKAQLDQEKIKLEQLRDTLLPKLMNGEIDLDNIEI